MTRSLAPLLLLCVVACSEEPETPFFLEGELGGCGSVVLDRTPDQVTCPDECPIAVQAYRVRDNRSCERASTQYVACVTVPGGKGTPGAGVLETPDGVIYVDSPAYDCGSDGCATVETAVLDRWTTCAESGDEGCDCVCQGGECAYDRFVGTLDSCNLPAACDPLTGDEELTPEQLQCYMDVLADGGPIELEFDVQARHHITGAQVTARRIFAVAGRTVTRLDSVAFDRPAATCELQSTAFFFNCDPEDPVDINIEDEDGLVQRRPCTDPQTWVINCASSEPVCPS
ncbi:MAG: hypothetical protein K0V04_35500 [Deltaproteobacteria bacterium]|nr:hypothetical protein [Deltaproteobacteria bacterium]